MTIDQLTKHAFQHTVHCLVGCSLGEIIGMALTTWLNWSNTLNIIGSIALSFIFGYALTSWSLYRKGMKPAAAFRTAVATDTTSIISMEAVDSVFILLVPGAISAGLSDSLFWWSLIVSLLVAFVLTVPVNRYFISRHHDHNHIH